MKPNGSLSAVRFIIYTCFKPLFLHLETNHSTILAYMEKHMVFDVQGKKSCVDGNVRKVPVYLMLRRWRK